MTASFAVFAAAVTITAAKPPRRRGQPGGRLEERQRGKLDLDAIEARHWHDEHEDVLALHVRVAMRCRADGGRGAPPATIETLARKPWPNSTNNRNSLTPTPSGTRAPPSVTRRPTVADHPHRSARRTAKPGSAPNARSPSTSKRTASATGAATSPGTRPRRRRPRHRPTATGGPSRSKPGSQPQPGQVEAWAVEAARKRRTPGRPVGADRAPAGCADVGRWWAYLPLSDLWGRHHRSGWPHRQRRSPAPMVPISPASPCTDLGGARRTRPGGRHDPHHARHHRRHRPPPPRRLPLAGRRPRWHHLRVRCDLRPARTAAGEAAVTVLGRLEVPVVAAASWPRRWDRRHERLHSRCLAVSSSLTDGDHLLQRHGCRPRPERGRR